AVGSDIAMMAYGLGVLAAFMTAFYSWRLLWLAFHGEPRMDQHIYDHAHEAPKIMWMPLLVLVAGALFSGWLGYDYFVGEKRIAFWAVSLVTSEYDILHAAHNIPYWAIILPTLVGVAG